MSISHFNKTKPQRRSLMEYRICFTRLAGDKSEPMTKEFFANSDQEALRAYQEFCCKAKDSHGKFYSNDFPEGLFRIDQREVLTRIPERA